MAANGRSDVSLDFNKSIQHNHDMTVAQDLGAQMRAVEITSAGGPDVLRPTRRGMPVAGPGEVVIRVAAAGVNGHDLHHRHDGRHPLRPGETDLPGLEASGVVVALGEGVEGVREGERVCALLRGGGYAEYCVAHASHCLPIPKGMSLIDAAGLPETCFTVWSNLFVEARLKPTERLLMNGGTSGIGMTAIQIASQLGVEVYATARGQMKSATCVSLGARLAIDYETEDFVSGIMRATGGEGVDVVLDIVAGDYLAKDVEVLRMDGRLVIIGAARGLKTEIDFMQVVRKRLIVTGSTLRPRSDAYKAAVAEALLRQVWPLYESGSAKVIVDRCFPLEHAADAHRLMEERGHLGKVLLIVDESLK